VSAFRSSAIGRQHRGPRVPASPYRSGARAAAFRSRRRCRMVAMVGGPFAHPPLDPAAGARRRGRGL
jgi:hypothetical protein